MRLTVLDLLKSIYKHKWLIIITAVCAFFLSKMYVSRIQTYSAEAVIRYKDACISNGYALDGSKFDANEIVSPKVIANLNKDLPFKVTDDGIRANTKITPVTPSSAEKLKESKEKLGEEYEYYPNVFTIKYKGNGSYYQTRDTLDKLINNYFKYYNEKYLYLASVSEIDYNLNKGDYDYIEQAEILQSNIDSTISILQSYVGNNEYRSPTTGLTFKDLINEFNYLSEFEMPLIFSRIYSARLTKDKDLLINKYTERKEQNELLNKNLTEKADIASDRMDAYVEANKDVPNSYNKNQNVGDDNVTIVQDVNNDHDRVVQEQTTYDTLIKNYVNDSTAANDSRIDAEHGAEIINIFSTPADSSIDYSAYEKAVQGDISDALTKLKDLYKTAFELIDDYNAYIPTKHIETLTGIRYYENVYASLYYMVAVVLGIVLACILAIVLEIMKRYAAFGKRKQADADEILEDAPYVPSISADSIDEKQSE